MYFTFPQSPISTHVRCGGTVNWGVDGLGKGSSGDKVGVAIIKGPSMARFMCRRLVVSRVLWRLCWFLTARSTRCIASLACWCWVCFLTLCCVSFHYLFLFVMWLYVMYFLFMKVKLTCKWDLEWGCANSLCWLLNKLIVTWRDVFLWLLHRPQPNRKQWKWSSIYFLDKCVSLFIAFT